MALEAFRLRFWKMNSATGQVIYTTAGGALANLLHKMTDDEAGFFQSEAFSEASRRIFHVCKPNPFFVFPRFFWIDLLFQISLIFQYVRAKAIHFALSCGDDNIAHGICFGLMVDGFTTHISWCPDDPDAGTGQKSVDLGSSE
jgi:hypothetical protein